MSAGDIANINTALDNIQSGLNLYTGNTLINYNNITSIVNKQNAILGNLYGGTGNINVGNVSVTSNINCTGISTGGGTPPTQAPFRVEFGTTATVSTTTTITFSQAFTTPPTVLVTGFINSAAAPAHYITSITITNAVLYARDENDSNYGNLVFTWMAIGS